MRKLPIGIQTFSEIQEKNYIYVDKTKYIHKLATEGKTYFLSRPSKFGKSILITAIKELFEGNEKLFEGLYIHGNWDWNEKYPVILLDFGSRTSKSPEKLELSLNKFLNDTATENNLELEDIGLLADKFEELIKRLHNKTGKKVVVLVDGYDMPITDSLNLEIAKKNHDILKEFYQVLKANDKYLKFVFLTGESKFSKASVFSGLNNIDDITVDSNFSTICGYTQEELENYFRDYISEFAKDNDISSEDLLYHIEEWYNGYSWDGENHLYNPYSIISLFKKGVFRNYWFETHNPSFFMNYIRISTVEEVDVLFKSDNRISGDFPSFNLENNDFSTVLLQLGYLTIKSANIIVGEFPSYELAIPNKEVNVSIFTSIIREFSNQDSNSITALAKKILKAITTQDNELLQNAFDTLVAAIPAVQYAKIKKDIREANYYVLFLSWLKLMGFSALGEVPSSKKTPDILLKKDNLILICEIKYDENKDLNDLAMEAINQIKDLEYYKPYLDHEVILLGVAFGDHEVKSRIEALKHSIS